MAWSDIPTVLKKLLERTSPEAYEARVLRGLVGTGNGLSEFAKNVYNRAKSVGVSPALKDMKYLLHYIEKWNADRSKLR